MTWSTLLSLVALGASPAPAPTLEQVLQTLQKPRTIAAAFVQTKTSRAFVKPQESRGKLFLARPGRMRLEYLEPHQVTLVVSGTKASMSYPKVGRKQTFDLEQNKEMAAVFDTISFLGDADPAKISERFTVSFDASRQTLVLIPRNERVAKMVTRVEAVPDLSRGTLTRIRLEHPTGETVWTFSDAAVDAAIDPALLLP